LRSREADREEFSKQKDPKNHLKFFHPPPFGKNFKKSGTANIERLENLGKVFRYSEHMVLDARRTALLGGTGSQVVTFCLSFMIVPSYAS
jgi:hypothetical protein